MTKRSGIFWELLRKAVHLSGLFILVLYTFLLNYFSEGIALLAITALLLLLLEIEHIRLEHKPKIVNMFNSMIRKREKDNITGSVFFVISCIICFAAFDYWVAVLAMFMTIFGDLFSAILGKAFGETKIYKTKSFVGTLAGLTSNVVVGVLILPAYLFLVLPMAVIATFVEMITHKLDDNLTVPLFAGFAGQLIVKYMGISLPPLDFTILGLF